MKKIFGLLTVVIIALAATAARAADFVVTTSADRDGVCFSGVDCSLREAVKAANNAAGNDRILFLNSIEGETFNLSLGRQLDVSPAGGGLGVVGSTAYGVHIRANNSRIFVLEPTSQPNDWYNLTLINLRLTGGRGAGGSVGGAVGVQFTNLTISSCWFEDNQAAQGGAVGIWSGSATITGSVFINNIAAFGGGFLDFGSTVTVSQSSFVGNRARQLGGGMYLGSSATTVRNVTISGNISEEFSAGVHVTGSQLDDITNFEHVTVTNNQSLKWSTGGVGCDGGYFNSSMSIFYGNRIQLPGTATDLGATCLSSIGNNILGGTTPSPSLGPLVFDGLKPAYHPLLPGSFGIDRGPTSASTSFDVRFSNRIADGNGDGVFQTDNGAAEFGNLVTNDADDFRVGSLRRAMNDAGELSEIQFDPGFFSSPREILATNGAFNVTKDLTIIGPGSSRVALEQTGRFPVVSVGAGKVLNLSGVTLVGGDNPNNGGGIYNNGTLNLSSSVIAGNTAAFGGAIYNESGRRANITNSTIYNNLANNGGGAIANAGTVSVYLSTIYSNTAVGFGGAAIAGPMMIINNSTLSGNVARNNKAGAVYIGATDRLETTNATISNNFSNAELVGGIYSDGGVFQARNTIVAGNFGGFAPDVGGTIFSFGYNLIGSSAGNQFAANSPVLTGNIVNVNAKLAPLGNYGGPFKTHALLQNSPAVNAGDPGTNVFTADQRGVSRPIGAQDIGAFEVNIVASPASLPAGEISIPYNQSLNIARLPNQFAEIEEQKSKESLVPFSIAILPVSGQSLPPGLTMSESGVISGIPGAAGTYTFTTIATDADGMIGTSAHTIVINSNQPPTLTPATVSRQQGSPATASSIATVSDTQTSAGAIAVTVTTANPLNGVTISNIVNNNGNVSANVIAACGASNASFTLRATDGGGQSTTATLNVNVSANTAPSLAYPTAGLISGSTGSLTPTVNSDNGSMTYDLVVSPEYLPAPQMQANGAITVNNTRGQGAYNFTVTATDNCGVATTAQFVANVALTVNKTADTDDGICDSDCSLREAIAVAVPGSSVGFSADFNADRTIPLNSPLLINKPLTINGPTAARLTLDAQNRAGSRVFEVNADAATTVNINNLTISRASNEAPGGGLFLTGGAMLNVNNCVFQSNRSGLVGGGIYSSQSRLNIANSQFRSNSVTGGGIGAAIYVNGGELYMRGSTIASNTAGSTGSGGGIGLQGVVPARIENSVINNNTARSGGGIVVSGGVLRLSNTTISDNSASQDGGGVFNYSGAQLWFYNSTIAGNTAQSRGGGVFNDAGSELLIANTIAGDNNAPSGADIGNAGSMNATGANIVENPSIGGTIFGIPVINADAQLGPLASNGGPTQTRSISGFSPAFNSGSNANVFDTNGAPLTTDQRGNGFGRIQNGTVDIGAYELQNTVVFVTNDADAGAGSLRQTIADAPSGAMILFSQTFFNQPRTIALQTGLVFTKSVSIVGPGSGLLTIDGENRAGMRLLTVDGGSISVQLSGVRLTRGNMSTVGQGGGGALFVRNASATLTDVVVENNRAADSGGGISAIAAQNLLISRSRIVGNQIINGGEAGGIYANGQNFLITDTTVSGNSASTGGGLTFIFAGSARLENSTVSGNTAVDGGGIYEAVSNVRLANVTIAANNASGRGGALYHGGNNSRLEIRNSTLARNQSTTGGGVFLNSATNIASFFANTIVAGNTATTANNFWLNSGHALTLGTVNLVESGLGGNGAPGSQGTLLTSNPKLSPLGNYGGATQTFALLAGSPAINAGSNAEATNPLGILTTDQRGATRLIGPNVDLGAVEQNVTFDQPTLANGVLGAPYNVQLSVTRQTAIAPAAATFEIIPVSGQSLPPGISLSPTGLLSGMPTTGGAYEFTVKATDQDGIAGTQSFTMNVFAPTAANVTVGGRLTTAGGNPIRGVVVTLTAPDGQVRRVSTGTFGNYRFDDVAVGATYVLGVASKKFSFAEPTRVVMVTDELTGIDFVTSE